jgi:polyisoprenoid-binding protein YceI
MTASYRFDPAQSRFTVQAFATGMLSFLGHSPTFAVGDFGGSVNFEGGKVSALGLRLAIRADSLSLLDKVSASDRREIEETMLRDVLEAAVYPEILYEANGAEADSVSRGEYHIKLDGRLSLHGTTQAHPVVCFLMVFDDGVRLRGESRLRLSDHRIRPVSALAGTIKLKDELQLSFDVAALSHRA